MVLIRLAWKNIWRNPMRSGVIIISVLLGVWAGLFIIGFSNGLNEQRLKNSLNNYTGHFQIHTNAYLDDKITGHYLPQHDELFSRLKNEKNIIAWSPRVVLSGLVSSPHGSYGASVLGVKAEHEQNFNNIHKKLVQGDFLHDSLQVRNPVVIGKKLAKRLNVKMKSRIVINCQGFDENLAAAFKVVGIYKSGNSSFDERHIYVNAGDLHELLGKEVYHEVIGRTPDFRKSEQYISALTMPADNVALRSWQEVAPELKYIDSSMQQFVFIFMGIILLALCFAIINSMLMAVLERTRELGMLMAIGMKPVRVFIMIVAETFLLTFTGAPLGILTAWATISYFGQQGVNLSSFSEGLEGVGISSTIYTELSSSVYFEVALMVVIAALLAAIYPSLKAVRLKPAEAIRK